MWSQINNRSGYILVIYTGSQTIKQGDELDCTTASIVIVSDLGQGLLNGMTMTNDSLLGFILTTLVHNASLLGFTLATSVQIRTESEMSNARNMTITS